jgi:hypothetical protein
VTEHVLTYNHDIVPQETGYWCGPASAQVCLNIQGIHVDEATLAAECGTDEGGTDYVGLIENCLNARLDGDPYESIYAVHDPPTADEKQRLWHDGVLPSINAGYGIVMNWVAPPGNYPVGIKGSPSPSYGGGTIFHYVTCAGYDDNPDLPAVWIADSGFWPWGYWISFDQCCTLIPPKGFAYANIEHTEPIGDPDMPDYAQLSFEQLAGPDADTGSYGWPQLGGRTVVDALAVIGNELGLEGFGPPPLDRQA